MFLRSNQCFWVVVSGIPSSEQYFSARVLFSNIDALKAKLSEKTAVTLKAASYLYFLLTISTSTTHYTARRPNLSKFSHILYTGPSLFYVSSLLNWFLKCAASMLNCYKIDLCQRRWKNFICVSHFHAGINASIWAWFVLIVPQFWDPAGQIYHVHARPWQSLVLWLHDPGCLLMALVLKTL